MADQDQEMNGEDFSQDVNTASNGDGANGEGTNTNGSAEAPGRDDDR